MHSQNTLPCNEHKMRTTMTTISVVPFHDVLFYLIPEKKILIYSHPVDGYYTTSLFNFLHFCSPYHLICVIVGSGNFFVKVFFGLL